MMCIDPPTRAWLEVAADWAENWAFFREGGWSPMSVQLARDQSMYWYGRAVECLSDRGLAAALVE